MKTRNQSPSSESVLPTAAPSCMTFSLRSLCYSPVFLWLVSTHPCPHPMVASLFVLLTTQQDWSMLANPISPSVHSFSLKCEASNDAGTAGHCPTKRQEPPRHIHHHIPLLAPISSALHHIFLVMHFTYLHVPLRVWAPREQADTSQLTMCPSVPNEFHRQWKNNESLQFREYNKPNY